MCEFSNTEGQKTLGPYNKLYTISKQYADRVIIPLCMSVSPEYDMLIVICVQQEMLSESGAHFLPLNCYNSISIYGFLWAISATLVYQRVVEGLFFTLQIAKCLLIEYSVCLLQVTLCHQG